MADRKRRWFGTTFSVGARTSSVQMLLMLMIAVGSLVIGATIAALIALGGLARRRRVPA